MHINKVSTYSFLACINNDKSGFRDFLDIFTPLIKRVISKMNMEGINEGGSAIEIKDRVDNTYKLDIPYPILKKIVDRIAFEENNKDTNSFKIYKDGSFQINKYIFSEYEELINQQENEVERLLSAYNQFLKIKGLDIETSPNIFDFLDTNKISVSNFVAGRSEELISTENQVAAQFIQHIKSDEEYFSIVKRIYLGSIITGYLEFEVQSSVKPLEFLLDTNFVIGVLDLTSVESNHTCAKIIEIASKLGYSSTVLDITIDETKALLHRTAKNFDRSFLIEKVDNESIYHACSRKSLNVSDLERLADNLEKKLDSLGISIVPNTKRIQNEAKQSKEFNFFKKIRTNKIAALHDATAIKYVQRKREKPRERFEDSICWFVSDTKSNLSYFDNHEFLPELIRAEDLVNLLWLSNPNVNSDEIIEIGFNRLITETLHSSLPSKRVLMQLDDNIQKYAIEKIPDKDIISIANRIAKNTIQNLEELNKLAEKSPNEFVNKLRDIAEKEEENKKKRDTEIKQFLKEIEADANKQIGNRVSKIEESYESKIDKLNEENEKKESIIISSYHSLSHSVLKATKSAEFQTKFIFWLIILSPLIANILIFIYGGNNQNFLYTLLNTSYTFFIGCYYFVLKSEFSISSFYQLILRNRKSSIYQNRGINMIRFKSIEEAYQKIADNQHLEHD